MRDQWVERIDAIVGLDARGFIFGTALALHMGLPFVMLRKKGKLPGQTIGIAYDLEYGQAVLEIEVDALVHGARVLVADDLLATGGTAAAAVELVGLAGAKVAGCAFAVELAELDGRQKLPGIEIQSLITYED